ncbi:MAG: hypothetical protein ABI477_13645 [Chryseolinea sp.]
MKSYRHKNFIGYLLIAWLCAGNLAAQDVVVHGRFLEDSLAIGDVTGFYLTAKYPSKLNVLFPDTTFSFAPFEYSRKDYFPTRTEGGKSYDSTVYYLSTFEVEKLQSLSLPVFQLNPMDCTVFVSPRDTIMLSEYVKNLPDTLAAKNLPLRVNTAYQNVNYLFNYPILLFVAGVLLISGIAVWLIFGKRIRKHYRLKRMHKMHQKFLRTYSALVDGIQKAFSTTGTESALVQWKQYMEQLESRPYTKLTTRETARLENNEILGRNLHSIDGAIYGHNTSVLEPLEHLKSFAHQRFVKKMEEVKHG